MRVLKFIKQSIGLATFLAVIFVISPLFTAPAWASDISIDDLYSQTNAERAAVGLPSLKLEPQLNNAATAKANNMITVDYWAHNSPSGATPWSFISASGYIYSTAGENLAKGFDTSYGVTAGWMASPAHKANILNSSYTDVGFAVTNGLLVGNQTTLVVAMYGSRLTTRSASTTPAVTPLNNLLNIHNNMALYIITSGALTSVLAAYLILSGFTKRAKKQSRAT